MAEERSNSPLGAQEGADNEAANDLKNLDDSAIGAQVACVQRDLTHSSERMATITPVNAALTVGVRRKDLKITK